MWPIGYIIRSPYSPLRLEMEMRPRQRWRDAFEDLLALESRGQMIDLESRSREAKVGKQIFLDGISRLVSNVNEKLKANAKTISIMSQLRNKLASKNPPQNDQGIQEAIKDHAEIAQGLIASGEDMIAAFKSQVDDNLPASTYMHRGQWMASLISSGALPGWRARISDSSEGRQLRLSKIDGDPDDGDGQRMTEDELSRQFQEGIPMQLGSPRWSTESGQYPEIHRENYSNSGDTSLSTLQIPNLKPSILCQIIAAECTKSRKGNISTKVALKNLFTDGTSEEKEVVDDASKVFEETNKAHFSMHARNHTVVLAHLKDFHDQIAKRIREDDDNELN